MREKEVEQYMTDKGYFVEKTKDSRTYEDKTTKSTIFHVNSTNTTKISKAWYHFEHRTGDLYKGDLTWYLVGKAYDSHGEYYFYEREFESLSRDELESFINKVENYTKL